MKKLNALALALAVGLCLVPVFAQHGHAGGAGGGAMGMGSSHANGAASDHGTGSSTGSTSAVHGKAMSDLLSENSKLSDKISSLTGESAQQACSGFKNLGQCVAAAHVSKNLGISFACLKSDMTGTAPATGTTCPAGTGSKSMSLGKSITTLSPKADSKAGAKQAQSQANQDLRETASNS